MSEAPVKISLREQAECAQRELAMRHRVYPGRIKNNKMTEAEAAGEIATMRAVRDTLRLFAQHENAIRAALRREIERAKDIEDLRGHPAVEAVLGAFPDAEIVDARRISDPPEQIDTQPQGAPL